MALALLALVTLAQAHGDVGASLRLDARARSTGYGDASSIAAADVELTPALTGALTGPTATARLSYAGTLRFREPYASTRRFDTYHRQSFNFSYARENQPRFYAAQSFSYGLTDLTTLFRSGTTPGAPTTTLPPSGVPVIGATREMYVDALLGVTAMLGRLHSLDIQAGYTWGGGVDAASRVTLPVQNTPRAAISLNLVASPRNTLITQLLGQYSTFDNGARLTLVQLAERWNHQWSAITSFWGSLGIAGAAAIAPGTTTPRGAVYPVVAGGLSRRDQLDQHQFELNLTAGLGPFVDRYLTTLYQRLELAPSVLWRYQRMYGSLRAGTAIVIGDPTSNGTVFTYGEGNVGYEPSRFWLINLSGVLSTVILPPSSGASVYTGFQWVVTLGVTVRMSENF